MQRVIESLVSYPHYPNNHGEIDIIKGEMPFDVKKSTSSEWYFVEPDVWIGEVGLFLTEVRKLYPNEHLVVERVRGGEDVNSIVNSGKAKSVTNKEALEIIARYQKDGYHIGIGRLLYQGDVDELKAKGAINVLTL